MDIIASPSTVIPLLLLLILIIYYLISLTGALREANQDLKNQLRRERQEERRKMLQRVVNAKLDDNGGNNAIDRWRKVLEASSPVTPSLVGQQSEPDEEKLKARREFLARIMKKALRKSSNTSEDESHAEHYNDGDGVGDDDETDAEQNEPLPHDQDSTAKRSPTRRKNSIVQLVDDNKKADKPRRKLSLSHVQPEVPEATKKKVNHGPERNGHKNGKKNDVAKRPDEHEDKISVVSERRALRRQRNTRESDGSISTQIGLSPDAPSTDGSVERPDYKATKPEEAPKKSTPKIRSSPEIFRFESDAIKNKVATKEPKKELDAGGETVVKTPTNDQGPPNCLSSNSSTPQENVEQKSPTQITPEKNRTGEELLKQPMKKINSFITLVREAVQPKHKAEHHDVPPADIPPIPSDDLQMRCRTFIDDSNPVSISEEGGSIKTYDSITSSSSSKVTYFEATKRRHRSDPPKPKRRDSQASIWSENIPVIRISKSESDECILERDTTETDSTKSTTQNNNCSK